jgi:hypothetical protein
MPELKPCHIYLAEPRLRSPSRRVPSLKVSKSQSRSAAFVHSPRSQSFSPIVTRAGVWAGKRGPASYVLCRFSRSMGRRGWLPCHVVPTCEAPRLPTPPPARCDVRCGAAEKFVEFDGGSPCVRCMTLQMQVSLRLCDFEALRLVSRSSAPRETPPAGSRPCRRASSASSLPSASREVCACARCRLRSIWRERSSAAP